LYHDYDYPDADAISTVQADDLQSIPDAVFVVGTSLKVPAANSFASDMCRKVKQSGGFTAWINLKPPRAELAQAFNFIVLGDCDKVAIYASSWWLRNCPKFSNDAQRQQAVLIARTPEEAIERGFSEIEDAGLSRILQKESIKCKILSVRVDGEPLFMPGPKPKPKSLPNNEDVTARIIQNLKTLGSSAVRLGTGLAMLSEIPSYWLHDATRRLENARPETPLVRQKLHRETLGRDLWRLKPGEELNDEILNAYFELLRKTCQSPQTIIEGTEFLESERRWLWTRFERINGTDPYRIFIPVYEDHHWSFCVLSSPRKGQIVSWTYHDSLEGVAPRILTSWIAKYFTNPRQEQAGPNPIQQNHIDCGLFVLMGIRVMLEGRPNLSQADSNVVMINFRQRVLAELLASNLDPTRSQFDSFKLREEEALRAYSPFIPDNRNKDAVTSKDSQSLGLFVEDRNARDRPNLEEDSSSDEDESEESSHRGSRVRKTSTRKQSPAEIGSEFAEVEAMVRMLRNAVLQERQSRASHEIKNLSSSELWQNIKNEKSDLKQRYLHYEFASRFHEQKGGPDKRWSQKTKANTKSTFGIKSDKEWKNALRQARKGSFWIMLTEIFEDLRDPCVALCAIPVSTYVLETMSETKRNLLFDTIRARLSQAGDEILRRLNAAMPLYSAVIRGDLPEEKLLIETREGLELAQVSNDEELALGR